jgi:hypothetical protein
LASQSGRAASYPIFRDLPRPVDWACALNTRLKKHKFKPFAWDREKELAGALERRMRQTGLFVAQPAKRGVALKNDRLDRRWTRRRRRRRINCSCMNQGVES